MAIHNSDQNVPYLYTCTVTYTLASAGGCAACIGGGCMTTEGAEAAGCGTTVFSWGAGGGWREPPLKGPTLKQMEKPLMSLHSKWNINSSTGLHTAQI